VKRNKNNNNKNKKPSLNLEGIHFLITKNSHQLFTKENNPNSNSKLPNNTDFKFPIGSELKKQRHVPARAFTISSSASLSLALSSTSFPKRQK
jgi:hypothetical protein